MKFIIRIVLILILFCVFAVNQGFTQVFDSGYIHVNPNENVYIQGDFTNLGTGTSKIYGTIHLLGNWYNYDNDNDNIVINDTGGLVRFIGSVQQIVGGTNTSRLSNIELNNASGLLLNQSCDAKDVFNFVNGKVFTNANYLISSNSDNNSIIGHNINRYVVGNLRRFVVGTSPYDLMVGTSSYYELAVIKFNSMLGINYINTCFVQSQQPDPVVYPDPAAIYIYPDVMNPIANPLSNSRSVFSFIYQFLDYGYWTINPNAMTSANYKLTVTTRGHTNGGTIPGVHALIKRINGSNPWGAYGIFAANSQTGTLTNPITVYMDQLSTFSDFIVGKSRDEFGPLAISLVDFSADCEGNKIKISWTTENEDHNDHFTIEKSKDLNNWVEVARYPGQAASYGIINYHIYDELPWNGITYYRLKQTDEDGSETIFNDQWLRYVNCDETNASWVKVRQDGKSMVMVDFYTEQSENYTIRIFDALGRLLYETSGRSVSGNNSISCTLFTTEPSVRLVRVNTASSLFTGKLLIPGR